jgi:hypothetical protein
MSWTPGKRKINDRNKNYNRGEIVLLCAGSHDSAWNSRMFEGTIT